MITRTGIVSRVALTSVLLCAATVPEGCANHTGKAAGIAIAAGAVIGTVVLIEVEKSHHTVKGCVSTGPNGLQLQSESDNRTYSLAGATASTQPGDIVKLHGRKERGDGGDVTFVVKKMSRDYGPCEPGFQAPVTPTTPAKIEPQPRKQVASDLERSIGATGSAAVYGVQFDTNSATLRPDSTASLEKMLAVILKRPDSRWIISGHTDNQGSAELNQKLSEARASSVIAWLVSHGIAASRFTAQGYGASRPVADNSTEEGRAKNRRVELMLVK